MTTYPQKKKVAVVGWYASVSVSGGYRFALSLFNTGECGFNFTGQNLSERCHAPVITRLLHRKPVTVNREIERLLQMADRKFHDGIVKYIFGNPASLNIEGTDHDILILKARPHEDMYCFQGTYASPYSNYYIIDIISTHWVYDDSGSCRGKPGCWWRVELATSLIMVLLGPSRERSPRCNQA